MTVRSVYIMLKLRLSSNHVYRVIVHISSIDNVDRLSLITPAGPVSGTD